MDIPNSAEAAAQILENDGNEYYEVPLNLIAWELKPNERRVLIVKNSEASHYRKYKPGDDGTTFYCWSCRINYGLRIEATFLNGIVKAPLQHVCKWIPLKIEEQIKKIKMETNDGINANPSSSSSMPSTSASKSNILAYNNISSNSVDIDDPDRPLSRESDIIFIDNDGIKPDYKDPSKTLSEKLQAFKRKGDYRTVAPTAYEEAYSAGGNKGNRLIVFEENDKTYVQQYAGNNNNYWYCLGCFRSKRKHTQAFREKDLTFLIPKTHFCTPILYDEAKKEQQKIINKWGINENDDEEPDASGDDDERKTPTPEPESIRSRLRSRSPAIRFFPPSPSTTEEPLHQIKKRPGRRSRLLNKKLILKENEYVRGVGARNQKNYRIFVFLDADKTRVHEYRKSVQSSFYCRGCYAMDRSKKRMAVMEKNVFRVPFLDEHICQPFDYAVIQEEQESIKEKYASNDTTSNQSKLVDATSSFSGSSSSSMTSPSTQQTPIYSGARLRSRTRTPVDSSSSQTPTSTFKPKTPVHQRERTPYPSLHQLKLKRKAERQNAADLEAAKKSKPTEDEAETPNSHQTIEKPKEISTKNLKYSRIVRDNTFKRNMLNAATATYRNGSQAMANSSTASSSTASTPVDPPPSIRQNVLYTSKPPPTCEPKPSNTSFIKSFTTISSTTLPPIPTSETPETIPPPPTPPSAIPTPLPTVGSSIPIISIIPSLSNLLSATSTPSSSTSTPMPSSTSTLTPPSSTTTVKFYKASQFFLKKCCQKLDLDYADTFWINISIHQVSPSSIPDKIHTTVESKYHGFECLSLYLTGAEDKATYIREKINKHMYYENTRNSLAPNRQIEAVALFSSSVTEHHFTLIASWLECRIGIYAEGEWKRYGNWDATDADIPILLMEFKNDKYSPILMLK